jgi:hypothetical protein
MTFPQGHHLPTWTVDGQALTCEPDLEQAVADGDCAVPLQPHRGYANAALVLDTRGVMSNASVERL